MSLTNSFIAAKISHRELHAHSRDKAKRRSRRQADVVKQAQRLTKSSYYHALYFNPRKSRVVYEPYTFLKTYKKRDTRTLRHSLQYDSLNHSSYKKCTAKHQLTLAAREWDLEVEQAS